MSAQVSALKARIRSLLLWQSAVSLFYVSLVGWMQWGDAFSALTGCLIGLVPQIYFSFRMYRQAANDDAVDWLGKAYHAQLGKWLMTGLMFIIAFAYGRIGDTLVLLIGYLLTQVTVFFAHMTVKR